MSDKADHEIVDDVSKKRKRSLGRQCAAYGCYNTFYNTDGTASGLHFFRFPQKNPDKLRWCNLFKRVDGRDGFKVTNATVLCEDHFAMEEIKRNPNHRRLVAGSAPSRNLFQGSTTIVKLKSRKPPLNRPLHLPIASAGPGPSVSVAESANLDRLPDFFENAVSLSCGNLVSVSTQTDFSFISSAVYLPSDSGEANHEIMKVFVETNNLKLEVQELNSKISSLCNQVASLESTRFYTGFPNFSSLLATFEYFEPKLSRMHYWRGKQSSSTSDLRYHGKSILKPGRKRSLSLLEEFVLVLMRLKVGLFVSDLSDRFGISPGQVSKKVTTWICFLYHELPSLFPFPSQDLVRKNVLSQFKDFPTTRIIIDCTEVFIEVPSSMKSQSQTWSEYKHHNTWKALVGISPTGCITFISKLWSGKVSDKEITLKSGVLSLLEDGDNNMANRGFDIRDILPPGVTLNIPPFKGQRSQLTAKETEETARIASVRIHVERAKGRVKNYHILDGILPLTLYPVADQIFTVCCLLTNFLPFLVNPTD